MPDKQMPELERVSDEAAKGFTYAWAGIMDTFDEDEHLCDRVLVDELADVLKGSTR